MSAVVETQPFWDLSRRGSETALVTGTGALTYADLADRVAALVTRLGPTRRLVLLEAGNDVDTVVSYLACLSGGHPVLVAPPGTGLGSTYDPDVVLSAGRLDERRPGTRHDLHPDLAVLMSTSGSTGSPKLVRLSRDAVAANARAVAETLAIRPTDLAATTLPLHYCYGLSVLTSHLQAGAALQLTSRSVVEPAFWDDVRRHRVTTFPGVPHTFDLLDRCGFADLDLPSLRYLTCAGGRLPAPVAQRYAELGQRRGFDLVLMYGATEATARMAVLSGERTLTAPHLLGDPVPGGSFELRPVSSEDLGAGTGHADGEVGELVFRGENVMLGYAESPADLARGRDVQELRTGDLARRTPAGLEVVGRLGRTAKVFGLRIDLDRVETRLRTAGVIGHVVDGGDAVVVVVDRSARPLSDADRTRVLDVTEAAGVPRAGCAVREVDGLPRRENGKVDHAALRALAAVGPVPDVPTDDRADAALEDAVAAVLGSVGRTPWREADTFVSRGGDSLSYVETSLRLERLLGHLPRRWHLLTAAGLVRSGAVSPARRADGQEARSQSRPGEPDPARTACPSAPPVRRIRAVETNVLLRALAIVLIVGSHSNLFMVLGGAHVLVGLAGYNLARFHLLDRERRERVRGILVSVTRVAVPTVLWLVLAAATSTKYDWRNVVLLNGVLGTREWSEAWHYWFVEALVWTLVGVAALLAVPAVHRLERRAPFWFPVGIATLALLTRYDVVRAFGGDEIHRAHVVLWLFALGWATAQATRPLHRAVVTGLVVLTVPGFFDGDTSRELVVIAGLLLLVWVPSLRVPAVVARVAGTLAGASLFIYLCHWQIYPAYEFSLPWLATGLSLAAGVLFWRVTVHATPYVERGLARAREVAVTRVSTPAPRGMVEVAGRLRPRRCMTRDPQSFPGARAGS